jgi:hypothetical protein
MEILTTEINASMARKNVDKKRTLTRNITLIDFEDFLLMITTTDSLSTRKTTFLFLRFEPQIKINTTTGNNSKNLISFNVPFSTHCSLEEPFAGDSLMLHVVLN